MAETYELSVKDRLMLLSVLPQQGDLTTFRLIHRLRDSVGFTDEELKEFNITTVGSDVRWENGRDVAIPFSEKAKALIAERLKALSDEKKMTEAHFRLFELFVPEAFAEDVE